MKNAANSLENLSKAELINAIKERDNVIHVLHEKLRLLGAKTYGVRSEQRSSDPQADLFNEADSLFQDVDGNDLEAGSISTDEADEHASEPQSTDIETITYERRKRPRVFKTLCQPVSFHKLMWSSSRSGK